MSKPEKDDSSEEQAPDEANATDKAYQRAARLLGQKLGMDWRALDADQVHEYMRKIEIGRGKRG
jgi:hypothetical protein